MKVILMQDVARIGRRFDIKDVPDGYALNFLIPKKLAEPATNTSIKRLSERKEKLATEAAKVEENLKRVISEISGKEIQMTVEVNEKGHLFQGIKAADIISALRVQGYSLDEGDVLLDAPIKDAGKHTVSLKGDGEETFILNIVAK